MSSPAMDSISVSDIDVAPSTQTQATIKTLPDELLLAVLGELSKQVLFCDSTIAAKIAQALDRET